jgi:biopolymer transport protein ExbD
MSSPSFVKHRPPSEEAAEIDVDVSPMISMFLILLPFLVSMAVLTQLTILEFGLPPNVSAGLAAGGGEMPKLKLTVVVAPQFLGITFGDRLLDSLAALADGTYDLDRFATALKSRKMEVDANDEVVVASRDNIRLKNLVAVMDKCKSAGFARVGLSSATEDPRAGE